MINFIKAELYRLFNRKFLYLFWGILALMILLFSVSLGESEDSLVSISKIFLVIPVFLWPIVTDAAAGEEFKDNNYINSAAYGITKVKFFVTKAIITSILVMLTIFFMLFFWSATASFALKEWVSGELYYNFLSSAFAALPLYIAAALFNLLLAFLLRKSSLSIIIYFAVIAFSYLINAAKFLGNSLFGALYDNLLTTQITRLIGPAKSINIQTDFISISAFGGGSTGSGQMLTAAAIGTIYILVFFVIGILLNRKWK
jgi:ABC-2 type transport system permease protein